MSVNLICATNKELNLISQLFLCLYMKITTCLLVLLNQSRDNACELVSSLSAYMQKWNQDRMIPENLIPISACVIQPQSRCRRSVSLRISYWSEHSDTVASLVNFLYIIKVGIQMRRIDNQEQARLAMNLNLVRICTHTSDSYRLPFQAWLVVSCI